MSQMAEPTAAEFAAMIRDGRRFAVTKFGDGEILCMAGAKGENCDGHPYGPALASALADSFARLAPRPDVWIARWVGSAAVYLDPFLALLPSGPRWCRYELIMPQKRLDPELIDLYRSVRDSKRRKVFVGPSRLRGVVPFLRVDAMVEVPTVNCFAEHERIRDSALAEIGASGILLTACSMPAKVLIADAMEKADTICLDVGSGFDSIFVGKTRDGQPESADVRAFFSDFLRD